MKIAAIALSAAILGAMSFAPASAAPAVAPSAVKAAATQQASGIELIQRRDYRDRRDFRGPGAKQRYRAGQRLKSPPRGYRRYDRRPSYWRTRNCVSVGPLWFCP